MADTELEELAGKIAAVTDKKGFAAILKEKAKPIYQQIFNEGHASGQGTQKSATETAEAKTTAAEGKLETLQAEFDTYKASKQDVASVEKEWKGKYDKLEGKFTTYKEEVKQNAITSRVQGAIDKARSLLKLTIDPDKADALVDKMSVRSRMISDDGKSLKILQPELQIPYAGDDEAQVKALVEELVKDVPAKFQLSDVERGTGDRSSTPGGSGDPKGKAKFDAIREAAKAKKPAADAPSPDQLLDRAFGRS